MNKDPEEKTASDLAAERTSWGSGCKWVVGVDPGEKGGVVAGDSLQNVFVVPYPQDSMEYSRFALNIFKDFRVDPLNGAIYYERRPVTDKVPGGAARLYNMGRDDGRWELVSVPFAQKFSLYPQTWRRIAFPTLSGKPVGSLEWKLLEMRYCRFFTGDTLVKSDKTYKSDNKVFGISAAFCIWLAGMKSQGNLDITQEISRIKGVKP